MSYELGFKVLDFLKEETDYYSWYPAITGFNWIRNRFLHLPEMLKEFDVRSLMTILTLLCHDFEQKLDNQQQNDALVQFPTFSKT